MATRHARTADKSTNDKHTRILKTLLQRPDNRFCVDCRKKDPRWASFNLGCFMCIRCSGVHRSMGTHITKVKSVDLDSWTVGQVENMIKWGNEKANMYWEARLPENSIPNENTSGIDPWIRSKYERSQYARSGSFPDPSELGPIDEAMLMELYGKSEPSSRPQAQMSRSTGSSASFTGAFAPPPANPTRSSLPKKQPPSSGLQGEDLFSIGQQPSVAKTAKAPASQIDFFGLNNPTPTPVQSAQSPKVAASTPSQDLFSMTAAAPSPSSGGQTPTVKSPNTDWKNSIMSLYGNQSSSPKPSQNGMGQPAAPLGQLQGMDVFGFGQAPVQQQHNPWGNDDAFGVMQQASGPTPSGSSFDAFGMSSNNSNGFGTMGGNSGFGNGNNNGFGTMGGNSGFNNGNINTVPQGGDFFNMVAGATKSPVVSPPQSNNKSNSAFGDLTWN